MSYAQQVYNFISETGKNVKIAAKMGQFLIGSGCCIESSGYNYRFGNSDHLVEVSPVIGNNNDIAVKIYAIDGITTLRSFTLSYVNNISMTVKMVYSGNGFGISFITSSLRLEMVALKLLGPNDAESWAVMANQGGSTIVLYTNGIDTHSVFTNANLVNANTGIFTASATFLYTSDASKQYTGKTLLVAGGDGLSALTNGGIQGPTIMRLDAGNYLWVGGNTATYVTDKWW